MIPRIDAQLLKTRDKNTMNELARGVRDVGFLTVYNTAISVETLKELFEIYRAFFLLPEAEKNAVNMALTGANRGWGAAGSEQVDPTANPDYKQVFDCGFELAETDPLAQLNLSVYAPNQWPLQPGFKEAVQQYYREALVVAMDILRAITAVIGEDESHFDGAFDRPMALLRGNYYPPRPTWASEQDFGIAEHTDYGCLTLLASDGVAGLEVLTADQEWTAVTAACGEFVINFGEMLEIWTQGKVKATLHRVVGTSQERLSIPLFFNPNYDANVAPTDAKSPIFAGDHLEKRFAETYLHLKDKSN